MRGVLVGSSATSILQRAWSMLPVRSVQEPCSSTPKHRSSNAFDEMHLGKAGNFSRTWFTNGSPWMIEPNLGRHARTVFRGRHFTLPKIGRETKRWPHSGHQSEPHRANFSLGLPKIESNAPRAARMEQATEATKTIMIFMRSATSPSDVSKQRIVEHPPIHTFLQAEWPIK